MNHQRSVIAKWALGGILFGLLFPAISWVVAIADHDGLSIWDAHASQPALWVTNAAPVILGIVGAVAGAAFAGIAGREAESHALAERVAKEWTAEIHEGNVNVAKNAELRSKYFAALSHDMRTPLTAILGFTDLAADSEAGLDVPTLHEFMRDIGVSARQLLTIINDLMDAAKMESGAIELMVDDIDGDVVAEQVVRHMRPLADEEHLGLESHLRAGTTVRADEQRFRQILINLVSNALKYTESGTVRLRSYRIMDLVVYEVEDTGAGISEEDMPKVFTAFEQTDVAKQRTDSTGLGLPVSLGMAEAMGGTIQVDSVGEGHGSVFRLILGAGTGDDVEVLMASLPHLLAA